MTISEAITKAIEGGYSEGNNWKFIDANIYWVQWVNGNGDPVDINFSVYLISPRFWQCLGKMMGWEDQKEIKTSSDGKSKMVIDAEWKRQWHDFINWLIRGGTPESFFKELK